MAGTLMAQPVYPSFGNTWCVPALTLRANGSHAASRADRLTLVNGIEVKLGGSRKSKIVVSTC